jgi:type III pantothenate kinase
VLLVLDIGNSNVVAGVYQGSKLLQSWRFDSNRGKTTDEYVILLGDFFKAAKLKPSKVGASILSSVVPPLIPVFENALLRLFGAKPMVAGPDLDLGLAIKTKNPEEVGADRLVNAVAGFERFGGPLLIVDSGTATTVDAVSAKGEYLGGVILPGINISIEALVTRTAKLPRIEMAKPKRPIGDSTVEAMRSGIYYGYVGQIRELISVLSAEMRRRPRVIATGGLSHWIPAKEVGIEEVLPDLTLEGLRLIYLRNAPKSPSSKAKKSRKR